MKGLWGAAVAAVMLISSVSGMGCRKTEPAQSQGSTQSSQAALGSSEAGVSRGTILGTWRAEGEEPPRPDGTPTPSWWVEYTFDGDGYRMAAHPPARSDQGTYIITSVEGRTVTVKLGNDRATELRLEVAEDGQSLVLDGFQYARTGR